MRLRIWPVKKQFIIVIIIIACSAFIAMGLRALNSAPEQRGKKRLIPAVEYTTVQKEQLNYSIASQGTVLAKQFSPISSEVSGRVTSIHPKFLNGNFVKKGDALLSIDTTDYDLAVANARAVLYETQLQLEDKNARYEKDSLSIKQAKAAYQAAQAGLAKAESDLEKTQIKAPYNGIVINKAVDIGQVISKGSSIAEFIGSDIAEIRLPINPADILHIAPALFSGKIETEIELTSTIGSKIISRTITNARLEGNMDRETRIFYITAEISEPYAKPAFPAGLFATAKIKAKPAAEASRLPIHAIHKNNTVYLLVGNQLKEQTVEILFQEENKVIISNGLNNGDKVVITKMDIMFDGMQVSTVSQ